MQREMSGKWLQQHWGFFLVIWDWGLVLLSKKKTVFIFVCITSFSWNQILLEKHMSEYTGISHAFHSFTSHTSVSKKLASLYGRMMTQIRERKINWCSFGVLRGPSSVFIVVVKYIDVQLINNATVICPFLWIQQICRYTDYQLICVSV